MKKWQAALHIKDPIEFQGLRKSGQMHKVRLSQNNYQLVAENSGQSPEVLMSNYNEVLESEKRALAMMVETSFYPSAEAETQAQTVAQSDDIDTERILQKMKEQPEFFVQIMQSMFPNTSFAS
jgi:hypothetical protein